MGPSDPDDPRGPLPPSLFAHRAGSALEQARELRALRDQVRERDSWLASERQAMEERQAALETREQDARTSLAEAAAARRAAEQFREDRDHARRSAQERSDELSAALKRLRTLEAELATLRQERRRRQIETIELRDALEAARAVAGGVGDSEDLREDRALAARHAVNQLEHELADARAQAAQLHGRLTLATAEGAVLQGELQGHLAAASAARVREIELLQRLSAQGDELAALRGETATLQRLLAEERRASEARALELKTELAASFRQIEAAATDPAELRELAQLREELAAIRASAANGFAPLASSEDGNLKPGSAGSDPAMNLAILQSALALRDQRLAALERELAEKRERVVRLAETLEALEGQGGAARLAPHHR